MTAVAAREPGLHRFAVVVAGATFLLVIAGGLVTSTGSGLAVPDWPLSFGQVFPRMEGGVFFEHGHRMVASAVGLLTVVLAAWTWRREPRRWVRRLGLAALGAVILQGVLGGTTVLLRLPSSVSVAHAGLAQIFFCLTVALAVVTSAWWADASAACAPDAGAPSTRTLTLATATVVYAQILLGAVVRHTGAGLAIPDFPLAYGRIWPEIASPLVAYQMAHRLGAVVVAGFAVWCGVRVLARHADQPGLRATALALLALVAFQVFLGALTIWTRRAVIPTTAHVATGALLLVTTVVLTLRAHRVFPSGDRAPAPAPAATR
jgi:cytochrome c oxidase assembly protein subunit 15